MEKVKGLLDELMELTGCLYLSDLHTSNIERIGEVLSTIEKGRYGASEWREAYFYITGQRLKEETETEVRSLFSVKN